MEELTEKELIEKYPDLKTFRRRIKEAVTPQEKGRRELQYDFLMRQIKNHEASLKIRKHK